MYEDKVKRLLKDLGVPVHLQGYTYLVEAITTAARDPSALKGVYKGMYYDIAKAHNTSHYTVERCIRHAVFVSVDSCAVEELYKLFGNTIQLAKGYPTNRMYIATLAEYIRDTAAVEGQA